MQHAALTPQKLFPWFALVLGLLYVFITPPFQVPDETNHFYRIVQIAQGDFIPDKRGNHTGGAVPHSVIKTGEGFVYKIIHDSESKLTKAHFERALQLELNPQDTFYFSFPNSSLYSPVSYAPQLLLVTPGMLLELKPLWLMYLGRIGSVLASVLLLTLAMRTLPALHWSLFVMVMLPMFLYQMASLSADAFLNSLAVLLAALAIRAAFVDRELTTSAAVKIFVVVAVLSFCKAGYLFLTLLFLLPIFTLTEKAQKRKWIFFTALLFVCAAGISMLWSSVIKATFSPYGNPGINPDAAVAFIKANPVLFTMMTLKNVAQNVPFYLYGTVGFFGWMDVKMPFAITILYLATLALVFYTENSNEFRFNWKQHLLLLGITLSICLIIVVSQYLVTTPAGAHYIERSQGRYFFPVLFPLLLVLRWKRFPNFNGEVIDKNLGKIVPLVAIVSSVVAFLAIVKRFYF